MPTKVTQGQREGRRSKTKVAPLGGLEPPASWLTAERASRLRHRGIWILDDEYHLWKDTCCCPMRVSRESKPHIEHPIRYGLVVRIPGSHPGGPGSIPGVGNPFGHQELNIFFGMSKWCIFFFLGAAGNRKNIASAGNRTRINCLEGSYADHYTTDA